MPEKKSKYDTDPLDPDFARQTEEIWSGGETQIVDDTRTGQIGGATRRIETGAEGSQARYAPDSEAPTRRIDDAAAQSYPSVFVPPAYQPPPAPTYGRQAMPPQAQPSAPQRNIAGLGIPERYANVLPYAPFYIGLVASIVELLIVPRAEWRTRFHAAQGLALQLALTAAGLALKVIGGITGSGFGSVLLSLAGFAFLVYSMVRVWKGSEHRLAPLSDAARFLNERIEPRK